MWKYLRTVVSQMTNTLWEGYMSSWPWESICVPLLSCGHCTQGERTVHKQGMAHPPSLVDAWAVCQTSPLVSVTERELQDTSQNCWCTMDVPALSECNTDTLHFQLWRELSECMGGSLKCFNMFRQNPNFTNLRIFQEHFIRKVSHLACLNISKHTKINK